MLNARQFCLKLIANVTYGYAAAGFSGRMPMAELADAIVQARLARHSTEALVNLRLVHSLLVCLCMRLNHTMDCVSAAHLGARNCC